MHGASTPIALVCLHDGSGYMSVGVVGRQSRRDLGVDMRRGEVLDEDDCVETSVGIDLVCADVG